MVEPIRIVIVVRGGGIESIVTNMARPGAVEVVIADTNTFDAEPFEIARLREQGATLRAVTSREACECDPDLVSDAFADIERKEG